MINLICNKDIPKNPNTAAELILAIFRNALETKIQQYCHKEFNALASEVRYKYGEKLMEFVQVDNGGKMGVRQKMKKKAEGTKDGFPDVQLLLGPPKGSDLEPQVIYIEFKRIGVPSQVIVKDNQLMYHSWLNSIGFKAYITNNPIFFRDVILGEVRKFYNLI